MKTHAEVDRAFEALNHLKCCEESLQEMMGSEREFLDILHATLAWTSGRPPHSQISIASVEFVKKTIDQAEKLLRKHAE